MTFVSNGNLKASIDSQGLVTFLRVSDGRQLLQTQQLTFGPVRDTANASKPAVETEREKERERAGLPPLVSAALRYRPISGEKVYGLGEHRTGSLQNKPISLLFQRSQVSPTKTNPLPNLSSRAEQSDSVITT